MIFHSALTECPRRRNQTPPAQGTISKGAAISTAARGLANNAANTSVARQITTHFCQMLPSLRDRNKAIFPREHATIRIHLTGYVPKESKIPLRTLRRIPSRLGASASRLQVCYAPGLTSILVGPAPA